MTLLSFSLLPDALGRMHDALLCLAKFSETVAIEAESDLLRLSVLNSTKTGYAAFVFEKDGFLASYSFARESIARDARSERFCCQIYIKTLLSIFKGRTTGRDKDTAVERCEFDLHEDLDETECRLVIKMICGLGVIRTYKLTYEPVEIQHAIFDRSSVTNQWSIDPRYLKEITDHFSVSAEQLDIYSDGGKVIFTSFTTKITEGNGLYLLSMERCSNAVLTTPLEILKQPVHTSVAIDKRDFEDYSALDELHIAITLKDFKTIIAHAETTDVLITARYTRPCRPLQLAYRFPGVRSEFTLMTTGEVDSEDFPTSSRAPAPELSARQTPAPVHNTQRSGASNAERMPPPRSRSIRPLTGNPTRVTETNIESQRQAPSTQFDSLFVPADDDRQWDVPNEDSETMAEDTLGWDATTDHETFNASLGPRLRDIEPNIPVYPSEQEELQDEMGIPPTQRISQVRKIPSWEVQANTRQLHGLGLFD
ncbi:putative DNA repair protein rad9 [Aspergillus clavatus NRRL 1]|uniref:DNA repair protein rad9 n=1 Tax=Aspergillus clavatus (strain ATCC 1007 / CBS 513.65 / DSM 816 / NCTC 3887 / NRRL 1 / QM 1276 / 107) TaxID=344612 RepID=A1C6B8_ASPCL|nr:DNA repair protein Rad9, putative [Aspergillus clavatus NRRL 1]EAW13939.1 DNA repair protein Rad9, putative [Aspergillus clavatus NRRL 1]